MAIASHPRLSVDADHPEMALIATPTHQAYRVLHVGFVALPLIAGVDKFFDTLCDWTQYLAPVFPNILHVSKQTFMLGVGVIEIVAALLVLVAPAIGGWVVMAWLWGIIINLLTLGGYYDVALRDFGLSLGAFALARLAWAHHLRRDVGEVEIRPAAPPPM